MHEKVSQMLSAFLDDELTQAEAQKTRIHLEDCAGCRKALDEMRTLRDTAQSLEFPEPNRAEIDQLQNALSVRTPRLAGWILIVVAVVAWSAYATWSWITGPEIGFAALIPAALVIGFVLLLVSVLRRRLLELPHDRYRRVKK